MTHPCIFCSEVFASLEEEVLHLFREHSSGCKVEIGDEKRLFVFYRKWSKANPRHRENRVRCICGRNFVCSSVFDQHAPVLPGIETGKIDRDYQWLWHLIEQGRSLAGHLQFLRDRAMLDKIAGEGLADRPGTFSPTWSVKTENLSSKILEVILPTIDEASASWAIDPDGGSDVGQT